MSAAKPAKRKPAVAKKAAAARAEKDPAQFEVEFRGLTLTVPRPEAWTAEQYFAIHESDRSDLDLLRALLGEVQYQQVRAALIAAQVPYKDVDDELGKLADDLVGTYGMDPGESEASPVS